MTLSAAVLGYQYFPDPTQGRPVYFGQIYIGVVDLDPQIPANQLPIQLRQEDGTLVASTQPILTGAGGVPIYNGSPVQIIVDNPYSIKVLNSSGAQVYYRADSSDNERSIITPLSVINSIRANMSTSLQRCSIAGHTTEGDGGGGEFWLDTSDTSTADDGGMNIVDSVIPRIGTWKRVIKGPILINFFGATPGTDATAPIRLAMAYMKTIGGGDITALPGIYELATNDALPWCVTVPANTRLYGPPSVIFQRPVAKIDEPSILFVNYGANTASGYGADGKITFDGVTIRDNVSAERTTSSTGSLIAFGHGDGLKVKNVHFGKHAQHCVDIGGSRNVEFCFNTEINTNGLTGYAENSAVQVDSANGAAFTGLSVDGTESEYVFIYRNKFDSAYTNSIIHMGHNNGYAKNIFVLDNDIKGSNRPFARLIKNDVDGASLDGVIISGNIIDCTTANNAAISLLTNGNAGETLKNIVISNNVIKGVGRFGVAVGGTSAYLGATYPNVENIVISNNTIDLDHTASTVNLAGISLNLAKKCSISDNTVRVSRDTDSIEIYGIDVVSCLKTKVSGNEVDTALTTYTAAKDTAAIRVAKFGSVATSSDVDVSVVDNTVDVSKFKYGLLCKSVDINDRVLFSANRFNGALTNGDAHIYEAIACSDGTNGYKPVDLGGGSYQLAIGIDTLYPISTGLIKISASGFVRSNEKIDITYTSSGIGSLATNTETLLTNGSTIGLQIKNRNPSAGTFDIATGSAGITTTINPGGAASTRTGGSISIQAGI